MADSILSWLSPKEAEARITGDPRSVALLRAAVERAKTEHSYMAQLYDKTIRRADKVPETVEIHQAPGLRDMYSNAADYSNRRIFYDPSYSDDDVTMSLVHELMHFINTLSSQPSDADTQHKIIQHLLGSSTYRPASELQGYTPPQATPEQGAIIKSWFGE